MSLSTSLANVGRAVAYYPQLSRFFGSVNAAIFFSQLYYWQARNSHELGIHKEAVEWMEETGLSYREQATARKILKAAGFLSETPRRLTHQIYYRLDLEAVDVAFDAWTKTQLGNDENAIGESAKAQSAKHPKRTPRNADGALPEEPQKQSGNKEKITTETTTENIATEAKASSPPMLVTTYSGAVREIPGELKYPGPDTKTHKTWVAYALCYHKRYQAWPVWNQSVAGKISQFIDRVGVENAPIVAAFFVSKVNEQFIVQKMHQMGLLLESAEKWLTQAQTNRTVTQAAAQQADKAQANLNVVQSAADKARAMIAQRDREAAGEADHAG